MKKKKLTKTVRTLLVIVLILISNQIGASAKWEWQYDYGEWSYIEKDSYVTGWKFIDGDWFYFDNNGHMKKYWIQDGGKWYYLDSSGAMAKNTTIDGSLLGSDGAWIQTTQNSYEDLDKLPRQYYDSLAQRNGDVVQVGHTQYNLEKLDKFIENYKNKTANVGDMVRITNYTDEGGAVIQDLIVDTDGIKFVYDNTRDGYASQADRTRKEYKLVDIYKEYSNFIFYYGKTDQGNKRLIYYANLNQ
jgi:hypothetical protein